MNHLLHKNIKQYHFSQQKCDALFNAVLIHDDIYPKAMLPQIIKLDYTAEQLSQCFQICRQIWLQGVDRVALRKIITNIAKQQALNTEEKLEYKNIRAKFKHLRFAYICCDDRHHYPPLFHWLTSSMGRLQDAFKNKQNTAVAYSSLLVKIFLNRAIYNWIIREINGFKASTPASFQDYISKEIDFLRSNLRQKEVTSKTFHEMRKVISRQVALYDNLKILFPTAEHTAISEYLSTLNGMMGAMHDELVSKKYQGIQNYYADTFELPNDIRHRLTCYVSKYEPLK